MTMTFDIVCQRCGKKSEITSDRLEEPSVKCGDCLMDRTEVVDMKVVGFRYPVTGRAR